MNGIYVNILVDTKTTLIGGHDTYFSLYFVFFPAFSRTEYSELLRERDGFTLDSELDRVAASSFVKNPSPPMAYSIPGNVLP